MKKEFEELRDLLLSIDSKHFTWNDARLDVFNQLNTLEYKAGLNLPINPPELDKEDLKSHTTKNVVVHLYDPNTNKPKPSIDDPSFSDDVCTIDEDGLHGVAFFNFKANKWTFYADHLLDEIGSDTKWMWYYPAVSVKDIEW